MKHPCQAVVVRYSYPASGELLNIGVVLLSPKYRFMGSRFVDSWSRVTAAFPDADPVLLGRVASAIERYCERYYASDRLVLDEPSGAIDVAFDAVIPREDAAIVRSAPMTGITENPARTLGDIFELNVAACDADERRIQRSDEDVSRSVSARLSAQNVLTRIQPRFIEGQHYTLLFEYAWQNGRWNVAKALSFDLLDPDAIATKAANWAGRINALEADKDVEIHLIVGMPSADAPAALKDAALHAVAILKNQLERAEIVQEDAAEAFAERVAKDIREHEAAE